MKKFKCLYIPIGVPTFHLESAQGVFESSVKTLKEIDASIVVPDKMLLTIDDVRTFIQDEHPTLIIVQNVTFAHSAYATEILNHLDAPMVLWTPKEPVINGTRLRLNALTGAFSAGFAHKAMRNDDLHYVYGSADDDAVIEKLSTIVHAAKIKASLHGLNLAMVGHTPPGFGFGRALDLDMASVFGVNLVAIESRELMEKARSYTEADLKEENDSAHNRMVDLHKTNDKNRVDFIRLYKAYKDYCQDNNVKALASRCWPDYFDTYGTPVCGVLGMLNDENVAAACEADAYGALSMVIGQSLSEKPTYLGDPVSMDQEENTLTFWHCGTSACSLAHPKTGATVGVHPNRKIGPTMEFGLKAEAKATVFRVGRKPDGSFRFFVASGAILDKPQQFFGTSLVFKPETAVEPLVSNLVKDGWEPHYAVIYGDVKATLKALAALLSVDVVEY